jgi:hypothetical protein
MEYEIKLCTSGSCTQEPPIYIVSHNAAFNIYEVITPRNVYLGENSIFEAIGMGSIVVENIIKNSINQTHIKYILHVSKLHANMLSMSKLVSNDLNVLFKLNECIVKSCHSEAIAIAPREGKLYEINFVKVP